MRVIESFALVPVVLFASACGLFEPSAADPHAVEDVVVTRSEPPRACRFLGDVSGDAIIGDLASAHRDLVKNAADAGGNFVAVDETERHPGGYGVRGRLFMCPSHIPSAPVMAAAPMSTPAPVAVLAPVAPPPAPHVVAIVAPPVAPRAEVVAPPPPTIAATPAKIEPAKIEPAKAEPAKIEPVTTERAKIEPAPTKAEIKVAPKRATLAEDD
ncbi:MAG TPA: hypothetical protein VGM56_10645 [Byssovorax sp.]|jgi:hypothetical protein